MRLDSSREENHEPLLSVTEIKTPRRKFKWIVVSLIAAAWHLLLLLFHPDLAKPIPPPPVVVNAIDPAKLQAIKNQWQKRALLLSKDSSPKANIPPPKNARYDSDRNRVVEKEMRARNTDILPQAGDGKPLKPENTESKSEDKPSKQPPAKNGKLDLSQLSSLSNLGMMAKKTEDEKAEKEKELAEHPRGKTTQSGKGLASEQALDDKSLPFGDQNILNTAESIYYSFFSRVYDAIGPVWLSKVRLVNQRRQIPVGEYITRVDVMLDHDGNFVGVNYITHCAIPELDSAVEDAWKKVPRFPNPPKGLFSADGLIHMGWSFGFSVDEAAGFRMAAPQRDY